MSNNLIEFERKFNFEDLLIFETQFWIWSLRPNQATLGAGVLSLKRECFSFSNLSSDEFSDLKNMIVVVENTLTELLKYNAINYLMLMMVDKQVHYHIIPRYNNDQKFVGIQWKDESWPGPPNLNGPEVEINLLRKISATIKEGLIL